VQVGTGQAVDEAPLTVSRHISLLRVHYFMAMLGLRQVRSPRARAQRLSELTPPTRRGVQIYVVDRDMLEGVVTHAQLWEWTKARGRTPARARHRRDVSVSESSLDSSAALSPAPFALAAASSPAAGEAAAAEPQQPTVQ
jgi:hypothetical protein